MSNATYVPWSEFFARPDWYNELFFKYADPRTKDSLLLQTPEPMLAIVLAYLAFVFVAPRLMAQRAPLGLKRVLLVYNFALVGLSAYMAVQFILTATLMGYSYTCAPVDRTYSTNPLSLRLVSVSWLFFFSKIIELADTVFFILRKKNDQVTFLHVYHHSTMIVNWWMAAKYVPVGQSFFVGFINSLIHTMMYVYYALTALGPSMQKYLWWKKYMTKMQLIQFVLIVSHTGWNKFVRTDCDYTYLFNSITFYYTWSMLFFFTNFYYQTYVSRRRRSARVTAGTPPAQALNGVENCSMGGVGKGVNGSIVGGEGMGGKMEAGDVGVRSRKVVEANGK